MTRRIRVDQIDDYMREQLDKLMTASVLQADKSLKSNSPVETGRFRASWAIGQNAAPFPGVPDGEYPTAPPPRAVNYELGREKIGNLYSIHNNLAYAEKLAVRGSPRLRIPGGWVDSIAKDLQTYIDAEADRIGRNS